MLQKHKYDISADPQGFVGNSTIEEIMGVAGLNYSDMLFIFEQLFNFLPELLELQMFVLCALGFP